MKKVDKVELRKLFVEMKDNNTVAFERLYGAYNKLVYGIAFSIVKNKQDAEDIVQIVFTKIYSTDKGKLPSKNEASWLYSITKNETINFLKKRKNDINLEDIYEIEDDSKEIDKIINRDSYHKMIDGLSDKEKEIVSLKVLADLSFDEIGKILKTPTGTIKWKYYKSIHTLKMLLSNLSMFIITAMLSIATLKNQKKASLPTQPTTNTVEGENNRTENVGEVPSTEETKKEENIILEDNELPEQENVIEIPNRVNEPNYIGLGLMGISAIFFVMTMIFLIIFTKHQLKRRKKLSK